MFYKYVRLLKILQYICINTTNTPVKDVITDHYWNGFNWLLSVMWCLTCCVFTVRLVAVKENWKRQAGASYRDDQWRDPAGDAGEHPAEVKHPHVLRRDDDGEAKDVRQRAEHQAELPADLLHHPAAKQAAQRRSHRHYGLKDKHRASVYLHFTPCLINLSKLCWSKN